MNDAEGRVKAAIDGLLAELERPEVKARATRPDPHVSIYWENLGWAQLLDFDMNRFYDDLPFQIVTNVRMKLWHAAHFDDDSGIDSSMGPNVGMYWDYTLVGMRVRHQPDGVPIIQDDHPMRRSPDLKLLRRHDFLTSGEMPRLLRYYDEMKRLTGDRVKVVFPTWGRGPLDMAMQLRGYEGFIDDIAERPRFVHDLMRGLVEERIRWWDAYQEHFATTDKSCGLADDWVNVPFISPAMFRDFVLPYYLELERYHGAIPGFHTCGDQAPIQKLLLQNRSLRDFEVTPWTSLERTLENVPADKKLTVHVRNTEVLLSDEAGTRRRIRRIRELCEGAGRWYQICGQALSKVHDPMDEDVRRARAWIRTVRDELHAPRA
jgi:hypothetical protein